MLNRYPFARTRFAGLVSDVRTLFSLHSQTELFYRNLFRDAAHDYGVALPALYPVGGAANYGLLYLLTRIVMEDRVGSVLEAGAGQSTLLLNALARHRGDMRVVTLEHDSGWADRMRSLSGGDVRQAPLAEREVEGARVHTYDHDLSAAERFDLVLVDGPNGTTRRSRWGCLELLAANLADEFIVIFDDAHRAGEQDTVRRFATMPAVTGRGAKYYHLLSNKAQCVFVTPAYDHLRFY